MPDADLTEETTDDTEQPDGDHTPEGDTFPREYVEKLRKQSQGYRDKVKGEATRADTAEARADELARALFAARVTATGKLADSTDLAFDAELIDDAEALAAAIDALLESKPHLRARKPVGSVGQGVKGDTTPAFSLLDRLKGN